MAGITPTINKMAKSSVVLFLVSLKLLFPSCLSLLVVDLSSKGNTNTSGGSEFCHHVHVKQCHTETVQEMLPRIVEVCWNETR